MEVYLLRSLIMRKGSLIRKEFLITKTALRLLWKSQKLLQNKHFCFWVALVKNTERPARGGHGEAKNIDWYFPSSASIGKPFKTSKVFIFSIPGTYFKMPGTISDSDISFTFFSFIVYPPLLNPNLEFLILILKIESQTPRPSQ